MGAESGMLSVSFIIIIIIIIIANDQCKHAIAYGRSIICDDQQVVVRGECGGAITGLRPSVRRPSARIADYARLLLASVSVYANDGCVSTAVPVVVLLLPPTPTVRHVQ